MTGRQRKADARMPILTGFASRRAAGVRMELQRRADTALVASRAIEDERGAAALRGKARGLREAVDLIRALENGGRIGRRRRRMTRAQIGPDAIVSLVLARELSDTGNRTDLDDAIAAFGFDRAELEADATDA